jgi:maleylacetate reductase
VNTSLRSFAVPGGVHNATPPRLVFGPGTVADLAGEVERLGAKRALVVTTPGRRELGERLADTIGERCVGLLPEAVSQVPIELARRGSDRAAEAGADCLVAAGGGAATGLCKGISYTSALPIIAVPTTYSGSEMTGFCGMTIDGVKRMHASRDMLASTVVYDAELSVGLPVRTSAASAMNALAHCVDSIYLPTTSPLLGPAAVRGAQVVSATLPRLLAEPDSLAHRNELLYGACLAGAALTGGFAIQHAIAHMLGGSFGVEHGTAHAVVLPYVTAHLVARAPQPLARIAEAVGTDNLPGHLWDLAHAAGLPLALAEVGIGEAELERAVEIALTAEEHESAETGNPAPVTEPAVRAILAAAAAGRRPEVAA